MPFSINGDILERKKFLKRKIISEIASISQRIRQLEIKLETAQLEKSDKIASLWKIEVFNEQ